MWKDTPSGQSEWILRLICSLSLVKMFLSTIFSQSIRSVLHKNQYPKEPNIAYGPQHHKQIVRLINKCVSFFTNLGHSSWEAECRIIVNTIKLFVLFRVIGFNVCVRWNIHKLTFSNINVFFFFSLFL